MDARWNTTSALESHGPSITAKSMILTIILLALCVGQIIFAAVTILGMNAWNQAPQGMLLSLIAVAFAAQMFAMAIFIPNLAAKAGTKKANGDVDQLLGVYLVKTVIAGAFLEGSGFLNLVAFMLEHNKWSLAPVAAGIFFLLTLIPTPTRIAAWVDEVRRTSTE